MQENGNRPGLSRTRSVLPLVLSCEHATHEVPPEYRALFDGAESVLLSHAGWDPGAGEAALHFRDHFKCYLAMGEATRLLVELNRSLHHPQLWSTYSSQLSWVRKEKILGRYYHPYRERVRAAARELLDHHSRAVHLSVHSLTPHLNGQDRDFDLALLFDPARSEETQLCRLWADEIRERNPRLKLVENTPYKGTDDGLTTSLRQIFPASRYLGIEIEFNQALLSSPKSWQQLLRLTSGALAVALQQVLNVR